MEIQKNYSLNFKAGLTKRIKQEINSCDVNKISQELYKSGVITNFKSNKTIAWCSLKCCEILKKFDFILPNGIFVEDFRQLKNISEYVIGFHNVAPTYLDRDNKKFFLENTIFFDEKKENDYFFKNNFWDNIDEISDDNFYNKLAPTDFFLYTFLHEFIHAAHEGNLIKNLGGKKTLEYFIKLTDEKICFNYEKKYKNFFNKLCNYALYSPFETIACDLGKRFSDNINEKLNIMNNFIENSPYKELTLKEKFFGIKKIYNSDYILRKIWHGKFE